MMREMVSASADDLSFDSDRLLDFVYVPYSGRIKDWHQLMKFPELLPSFVQDLNLQIEIDRMLTIKSHRINVELERSIWPIEPNGKLSLEFALDVHNNDVRMGLRRMQLVQFEKDDYFTVVKRLRPYEGMDDAWQHNWDIVKRDLHPFDRKAFYSDGYTSVATRIENRDVSASLANAAPHSQTE